MNFIKKHQMKIMLIFIGILFMFIATMYYQYEQVYDAQVKYEQSYDKANSILLNYKRTLSDMRVYLQLNEVDENLANELNNLVIASTINSVNQLPKRIKPAQQYYVEHEGIIYDLIDSTISVDLDKDTLSGMMNAYELYSSGLMSSYELLEKYSKEYNKNMEKYHLISKIYKFKKIEFGK